METPLDPRVLATVRALEVRAREAVRAGLGGAWSCARRGAGVEFAEVRDYVVGDDARTLDWNVSARTGRLQVKRYDEEREQSLLLLLDGSRSTARAAGRRPWRAAAAELLTVLGWSAAQAGDRVGAAIFARELERWFAPRPGVTALLALVTQWLQFAGETAATDLDAALEAVLRIRGRPLLLMVVSDMQSSASDATLARVAARHDLVLVALRAGLLASLPTRGRWRFDDPEGGAQRVVDLGDRRVRAALLERMAAAKEAAAARATRLGAEWLELDADGDLGAPLLAWARRRALRRGR
ncbi:MAG: DUF58 domain-containing protein [Planctomycetes bacterium]|nr:DUF58 domain-containing protein [Planctomycetota bacterium]